MKHNKSHTTAMLVVRASERERAGEESKRDKGGKKSKQVFYLIAAAIVVAFLFCSVSFAVIHSHSLSFSQCM